MSCASSLQICDYCTSIDVDPEKAHPVSNVVDGRSDTWWQSPAISRGLKYNKVTLDIDLQQTFQVVLLIFSTFFFKTYLSMYVGFFTHTKKC